MRERMNTGEHMTCKRPECPEKVVEDVDHN